MNMAFFILLTVLFANLHGYSFTADSGENYVEVTDKAPCVIGKSYTLSCKLKELRSAIEWSDGNDIDAIAHCDHKDFCGLNPVFEGLYIFEHNLSENYFNLTILNVTENFVKKRYVCSVGSHSACRILRKGEPKLEEGNENITAKSACCSQDREAEFKWFKIDPDTNKSEEFRPKLLMNISERCSHDCGGNQNMKVNQVISAKRNGNGTKYYLKVEATYGNETRIESSITTDMYEIEELAADTKSEESEDTASPPYLIVGIIVGIVVGVTALSIFLFIIHRTYLRKKRNPGKDTVDVEESFINAGKKEITLI